MYFENQCPFKTLEPCIFQTSVTRKPSDHSICSVSSKSADNIKATVDADLSSEMYDSSSLLRRQTSEPLPLSSQQTEGCSGMLSDEDMLNSDSEMMLDGLILQEMLNARDSESEDFFDRRQSEEMTDLANDDGKKCERNSEELLLDVGSKELLPETNPIRITGVKINLSNSKSETNPTPILDERSSYQDISDLSSRSQNARDLVSSFIDELGRAPVQEHIGDSDQSVEEVPLLEVKLTPLDKDNSVLELQLTSSNCKRRFRRIGVGSNTIYFNPNADPPSLQHLVHSEEDAPDDTLQRLMLPRIEPCPSTRQPRSVDYGGECFTEILNGFFSRDYFVPTFTGTDEKIVNYATDDETDVRTAFLLEILQMEGFKDFLNHTSNNIQTEGDNSQKEYRSISTQTDENESCNNSDASSTEITKKTLRKVETTEMETDTDDFEEYLNHIGMTIDGGSDSCTDSIVSSDTDIVDEKSDKVCYIEDVPHGILHEVGDFAGSRKIFVESCGFQPTVLCVKERNDVDVPEYCMHENKVDSSNDQDSQTIGMSVGPVNGWRFDSHGEEDIGDSSMTSHFSPSSVHFMSKKERSKDILTTPIAVKYQPTTTSLVEKGCPRRAPLEVENCLRKDSMKVKMNPGMPLEEKKTSSASSLKARGAPKVAYVENRNSLRQASLEKRISHAIACPRRAPLEIMKDTSTATVEKINSCSKACSETSRKTIHETDSTEVAKNDKTAPLEENKCFTKSTQERKNLGTTYNERKFISRTAKQVNIHKPDCKSGAKIPRKGSFEVKNKNTNDVEVADKIPSISYEENNSAEISPPETKTICKPTTMELVTRPVTADGKLENITSGVIKSHKSDAVSKKQQAVIRPYMRFPDDVRPPEHLKKATSAEKACHDKIKDTQKFSSEFDPAKSKQTSRTVMSANRKLATRFQIPQDHTKDKLKVSGSGHTKLKSSYLKTTRFEIDPHNSKEKVMTSTMNQSSENFKTADCKMIDYTGNIDAKQLSEGTQITETLPSQSIFQESGRSGHIGQAKKIPVREKSREGARIKPWNSSTKEQSLEISNAKSDGARRKIAPNKNFDAFNTKNVRPTSSNRPSSEKEISKMVRKTTIDVTGKKPSEALQKMISILKKSPQYQAKQNSETTKDTDKIKDPIASFSEQDISVNVIKNQSQEFVQSIETKKQQKNGADQNINEMSSVSHRIVSSQPIINESPSKPIWNKLNQVFTSTDQNVPMSTSVKQSPKGIDLKNNSPIKHQGRNIIAESFASDHLHQTQFPSQCLPNKSPSSTRSEDKIIIADVRDLDTDNARQIMFRPTASTSETSKISLSTIAPRSSDGKGEIVSLCDHCYANLRACIAQNNNKEDPLLYEEESLADVGLSMEEFNESLLPIEDLFMECAKSEEKLLLSSKMPYSEPTEEHKELSLPEKEPFLEHTESHDQFSISTKKTFVDQSKTTQESLLLPLTELFAKCEEEESVISSPIQEPFFENVGHEGHNVLGSGKFDLGDNDIEDSDDDHQKLSCFKPELSDDEPHLEQCLEPLLNSSSDSVIIGSCRSSSSGNVGRLTPGRDSIEFEILEETGQMDHSKTDGGEKHGATPDLQPEDFRSKTSFSSGKRLLEGEKKEEVATEMAEWARGKPDDGNAQVYAEYSQRHRTLSDIQFIESLSTRDLDHFCEVVNSHLLHKGNDDKEKLKAAVRELQERWFEVAAIRDADVRDVRKHLTYFGHFSDQLLECVIHFVDLVDENNVLHYAFFNNRFDVAEEILKTGIASSLLSRPNKLGVSPMIICALSNPQTGDDWFVVQKTMELGNVDSRDLKSGQTPLMCAVSRGAESMARLLLACGADQNAQDADGSTALMFAAEHGRRSCARILLEQPECRPDTVDYDGSTACSIALEAGHTDVGLLIYFRTSADDRTKPQLDLPPKSLEKRTCRPPPFQKALSPQRSRKATAKKPFRPQRRGSDGRQRPPRNRFD